MPINGGTGTCGPKANGYSDLGNGVAILPAPFDQVTQTCSKDQDCKDFNAGVDLNVGKLVRDATGLDGIGDGSLHYEIGRAPRLNSSHRT